MGKSVSLIALLLILIGIYSCEKERGSFTQIKGQVLERGTRTPLPNILVKLVQLKYSTLRVKETIIDTTRTDSHGNYSFSFDTDARDAELLVFAEDENYFNHNLSSDVSRPLPNVLRGVNQKVDIVIIPFAWVKITAKHTLGNDYVFVNPIIGSGSPFGIIMTDGMTKTRRILGNSEIMVATFLTKNNIETDRIAYKVNTIARDTAHLLIYY